MPSKVLYNDFRGGMLSEKLRRRVDLQNYQNSASLLENVTPMRAGGLRLRAGMKLYAPHTALPKGSRIIPYTVSNSESYSVVITPGRLYIYGPSADGGIENKWDVGHAVSYTESEIREIIYTQNQECMVITQRNHAPLVIRKRKGIDGFSVDEIVLNAKTDKLNDDGSQYTHQYDGLFTTRDFPSACAFMSERLWFMGSEEHPYRMWASRPFDIFNFQTKDWYAYLDEETTAEQYIKALSQYGSKTEMIDTDESIIYEDIKTVSSEGYVTIQKGIKNKDTGEWLATTDSRLTDEIISKYGLRDKDGNKVNPKTEAFYYTKSATKYAQVVREDCALELDLSSDRDERISWIGYAGKTIYIGTASSEWVIPAEISAISIKNEKPGSYGSAMFRQCAYGANSIFYTQSGARRLRAITSTEDGIEFSEPTYQADDIFTSHGGIVEIAWQRVPEPRLYATLSDGCVAVLSHDPYYGMSAWSLWTSEYKVQSLSIRDTLEGQEAVALVESPTGEMSFAIFAEGRLTDGERPFKAKVVTNNIDSTTTMALHKRPYNIFVDTMGTEFKASQSGCGVQASRIYGKDLTKLAITGNPTDGLRIAIESMPGKDFMLLALIVEVEVS